MQTADCVTTRLKHGLMLLQTSKFDKETCQGEKKQKCYMTNLGTQNGHVSKPKIQMQSIIFPGVPTV